MKRFNFEGYKKIAQCREKDLVDWLGRQIPKIYEKENCEVTSQYIFARGKNPVILLAHMDTVFKEPPKTILYDEKQGLIMSPQGIGGDDRNGIYTLLYLITHNKSNLPSVLFTTQEEHGCVGARAAAKPLKEKVKGIRFAIQIDRQGKDDAVFYQCYNQKFIDYICSFGYKQQNGSCTDICSVCPEWNIAGVNFSCGYMNNHREIELVNVKDMFATIDMVQKILDDVASKPEQEIFPYAVIGHKKKDKKEKGKGKDKSLVVIPKQISGETLKAPVTADEAIKMLYPT